MVTSVSLLAVRVYILGMLSSAYRGSESGRCHNVDARTTGMGARITRPIRANMRTRAMGLRAP